MESVGVICKEEGWYLEVEDRVFLKLSPWKGMVRFGKRGKLSPRYIGPFEIVERIGPVAYRLDLPEEIPRVHNAFHISKLCKYNSDPSLVIEAPEIELRDDLSYEGQPVQILGREEKELRNKTISLVKVLWRNHLVEEATWEREDQCGASTLTFSMTQVRILWTEIFFKGGRL